VSKLHANTDTRPYIHKSETYQALLQHAPLCIKAFSQNSKHIKAISVHLFVNMKQLKLEEGGPSLSFEAWPVVGLVGPICMNPLLMLRLVMSE